MLIFLAMLEDEGDSGKFTELYQQYKGLAFWVAKQIIGDDYLAEDVVQEAFTRIAKNFSKISIKNDISCNKTKSFIVIVVERTAIDFYRKRKRIQQWEVYPEKWESSLFAVENPPLKEESAVYCAMKELPKKYSEILFLHYVNGLSSSEISGVLKIKDSTVRTRIARGKRELEKLLADWLVRRREEKEASGE